MDSANQNDEQQTVEASSEAITTLTPAEQRKIKAAADAAALAAHGLKAWPTITEADREAIEEWREHWQHLRAARNVPLIDADGQEFWLDPTILPTELDDRARVATFDEIIAEP